MVSTIIPGEGKQYIQVDNSWVVSHSPELIRKLTVVTVEVQTRLHKDESTDVVMQLPTIDEIQRCQDARYISDSEGAWRLLSFPTVEHHPNMERLEVHLEGKHKM